MTLHRRRFVSLAAATGAAVLAGCMHDGDDGTGTDSNDTDDAADEGTSAREAYPDYDWSLLENVPATGTDTISIENNEFVPIVARVPVDTRITVSNEDSIPHTFTVPRAGIDERIEAGGQTSVRFDATGTYEYVCTLHPPSMVGRLVIEEDVDTGDAETSDGSTDDGTETTSDGGSGGGSGY